MLLYINDEVFVSLEYDSDNSIVLYKEPWETETLSKTETS